MSPLELSIGDIQDSSGRPSTKAGADIIDDAILDRSSVVHVSDEFAKSVLFYAHPAGPLADRFRLLRMRLRELWVSGKLRTLLVTSPLGSDGKSMTTVNLATALAEERNRRVLVIDADLHRGALSETLGLSAHDGLGEYLKFRPDPFSVIRRVEPYGWHLMSAGQCKGLSPAELLNPRDLSSMLQKLSPRFDWIIIDSPPALALSDAFALRQHADGTLLVARAGVTPKTAVDDAIKLIGRKHIVGMVLNAIDQSEDAYSKYPNYYRREQI
jgi:capsular exopolysaccharide synthesis family protein